MRTLRVAAALALVLALSGCLAAVDGISSALFPHHQQSDDTAD